MSNPTTYYKVGGVDLSNIFYPLPFTVTGNPTYSSDSNYNPILTFTTNGSIKFNTNTINTVQYTVTGGGGNGGNGDPGNPIGPGDGGGGGGGGATNIGSFTPTLYLLYTITVGGSTQSSSISNIITSSAGGNGSQGGQGGTGGIGTNSGTDGSPGSAGSGSQGGPGGAGGSGYNGYGNGGKGGTGGKAGTPGGQGQPGVAGDSGVVIIKFNSSYSQATQTGYRVNGQDLNQIFTPINSPPIPQTVTPVPATNFYTTQGNPTFNTLYSQIYNSSEANTFATSITFKNIYYSFYANNITYSTNYGTDWYTSAIQNPPSTTIMRRTICNNVGDLVTVIVDASTYGTTLPIQPTSINVLLYQSTDFAKNWLPLDLSTNETWTNISTNGNGDTIYACSSFTESPLGTINSFGSVYVSNNYGESWEDITPVKNQYKYLSVSTSSNSDITLASFFINNTQQSGIYKYTNNTWSIINSVPHNTNPNFSDYSWEFIKISSDGNTFLIASTTFNNDATAFISIICLFVDSGLTWSTIYTSSEYLVISLAMSPDANNMYYAISYYGSPYSAFIYKSINKGATFNQFYTKSPFASIRYMSADNNNKLYFLQSYLSSGLDKIEIVNYSNVYDLSKIFLPLDYNNQDISIFDSNADRVSVSISSAPDGVTKYIILSNYNNTTYSIYVNYSPSINLSYLIVGGGGTGGNGVYNLQTYQTALWCCSSGGGGGSGEIIYSNQTTTLPTGQSNISFTVSTSGGTKGTGYITYNINDTVTCTVNSGGRGGNGKLNYTSGINPPTSATGGSGGIGASGGGGSGNITYYPGVNGTPGEANPPTGAISQSTNPGLFANGGNGATSNIPGNTFTFGGQTIQIGLGGNGAYRDPNTFLVTNSISGIIGGGSGGGAGITLGQSGIINGASGSAPYILLYWTRN